MLGAAAGTDAREWMNGWDEEGASSGRGRVTGTLQRPPYDVCATTKKVAPNRPTTTAMRKGSAGTEEEVMSSSEDT